MPMLEAFSFLLASVLGNILRHDSSPEWVPYQPLGWHEEVVFDVAYQDDPETQTIIDQYLAELVNQGKEANIQGIWVQSNWLTLASHQGTVPLSAASLTKIATTLAVLQTWSLDHQFVTRLYHTGSVVDGVLQGNLIVEGGNDPLFVWEEAIALGNALNRAGIRQVEGDLLVLGNFAMNYLDDSVASARLLRQAMDQRQWSPEITQQYQAIAPEIPKPQVAIAGSVQEVQTLPNEAKLMLQHRSLTLADILKLMNIYSNNAVAEMLASSLGGGQEVAAIAAELANVPVAEIQLINGSGLGTENQISPRAATAMLMAIDQLLKKQRTLTIFDVFPVAGRETKGTMQERNLPSGIALKTGTLNQVSALAGVIPTQEHGEVWFAIVNNGTWDIRGYRQQQDRLLQNFAKHWNLESFPSERQEVTADYFGNPARIEPL